MSAPARSRSALPAVTGLDQSERLGQVRARPGVPGGEEPVRPGDGETHQIDHGAQALRLTVPKRNTPSCVAAYVRQSHWLIATACT